MKDFTFRLPWIVGIVLSVLLAWAFPAKAASSAYAARVAIDLPAFLGMPLTDALTFLVSAGVLGSLVILALKQFNLSDDKVQWIAGIVVSIASAALTAGLKFVPPDVLGLNVWQSVLGVLAFLASLAGAQAVKRV